MFDITAPIEHQFTRGGRKVLVIYDSKLDCKFPIAAWIEENSELVSLCSDGSEISADVESSYDIITRPEPLPLIVGFHRIFESGASGSFTSFDAACDKSQYRILAVMQTTFDPNTGTSSAETVWKKEAK